MFDDGESTNRAFSETLGNAAVTMASDIGTPIVAMDDDNDMLTYSPEGTDAARFGIDTTTGQLRTKVGEKYDYEVRTSYAVTVRVVDGNGGEDTIDVTVNVNNSTSETPQEPAAPTVTPTSGDQMSLDVNWTGAGQQRPADDYRLRSAIPYGDGRRLDARPAGHLGHKREHHRPGARHVLPGAGARDERRR